MQNEELITVKEFSRMTSLAEVTIRQWISKGKIKSVTIAGARRIYRSEIQRLTKEESK